MKTLITIALLFGSLPAFAANNFYCQQVPSGPDHGYQALFSNNLHRATISEQTIAGPRRVAILNCSQRARTVSCYEPRLRDAGYSLSVQINSRGSSPASLFAITFAGSRRIANLVCRRGH